MNDPQTYRNHIVFKNKNSILLVVIIINYNSFCRAVFNIQMLSFEQNPNIILDYKVKYLHYLFSFH